MFLEMLECGMKYETSANPLKRVIGKVLLKLSVWRAEGLEKSALKQKGEPDYPDPEKLLKSIEKKINEAK